MSIILKDYETVKSATLIISLLFLIGCINSEQEKLAETAILSMKKLEARCNVGINYFEYTKELGEAWYSIRLFIENKNVVNLLNTKEHIIKAFEHYKFASSVWKFTALGLHEVRSGFFYQGNKPEEAMINLIRETYPNAPKAEYDIYETNILLPYIWKQASEEIKKASDFLEKENNSWFSKLWK